MPLVMVRKERLELSRVPPLVPKTSASTNSATFASYSIQATRRYRYKPEIITTYLYAAHP